jgi:hypothetical protein
MALTKTFENDKIECVGGWTIQVRTATVIKDDGKEISRSYHRKILYPGTLDASDNLVDTNLSSEDADVKAIAEAAWGVGTVKADFKAHLIAEKDAK